MAAVSVKRSITCNILVCKKLVTVLDINGNCITKPTSWDFLTLKIPYV